MDGLLREAATTLFKNHSALYVYRDPKGLPLYGRVRIDQINGKRLYPVSIDDDGVYQKAEPKFDGGKPLYALDVVAQNTDSTVWVVEGEKCVDSLNNFFQATGAFDHVATTSGGATSAPKGDWSPLNGRHVIIMPDNDQAGLKYADSVARVLKARAGSINTVQVSELGLSPGGDIVDWLEVNDQATVHDMQNWPMAMEDTKPQPEPKKQRENTGATKLIALAQSHCMFFHSPDGEAYAKIQVKDHAEIWNIDSRGFEEWLFHQFYTSEKLVPSEATLINSKRTLSGQAKFEGPQIEVHTRVAMHDGSYWIDLCNETWQAVKVNAQGWEIVDNPPVHFVRGMSMRPLPIPSKEGDISKLWEIVNISADDRLIALSWMLECFRPDTPYPVLELTGTQGSAKSTTQRYLREFIDPNKANNRAMPKNAVDIFVAARNSHLVSLENLSHLHRDYQDALCTLATGGGFAGRTLYSDGDETTYDVKKPIALNGIAVIVTAQDLADRTVHFDLPEILDGRRTDVQIESLYKGHRAQIFGGILDAFAAALEALPEVIREGHNLPRMADFALLGEAVFRTHGKPKGSFISTYAGLRKESVHRTLEGSPVAMALQAYVEDHPGTSRMLVKHWFNTLEKYKPGYADKTWPQTPRGFGDAIRRVQPALRMIGIEVSFLEQRTKHGHQIEVKQL